MSSVAKPLAGLAVVLVGGLLRLASCGGVEGCNPLPAVDSVNDSKDDANLQRCRELGRQAQDAGKGDYYAYDVYYDCTKDAGLRK